MLTWHGIYTTLPRVSNHIYSMASINSWSPDERVSFEDYKVKVWLDNNQRYPSTATVSAIEPELTLLI
jgi:hypothetical protein